MLMGDILLKQIHHGLECCKAFYFDEVMDGVLRGLAFNYRLQIVTHLSK